MPHATESEYDHIQVNQLAPTFGAEVTGVDFSKPVPKEVFAEIHRAITQYGVLVFRHASLDDARHVAFSALFGELDDVKPYLTMGRKNRFPFDQLFDVSNLEDDGSLVKIDSKRDHMSKACLPPPNSPIGNSLFHVDSSFNPRRAGFSCLCAHTLPPPGHGGNTDFADTRAAFDDLPAPLKAQLLENDFIAAHSLMHSRKKAAPADSVWLKDVDPEMYPFGRHRVLQVHEASGRGNLYIANHIHHLEYLPSTSPSSSPTSSPSSPPSSSPSPSPSPTPPQNFQRVPEPQSTELIETLLAHATQDKYILSVEWRDAGDLVVWDNTCVMHRAGAGTFMERFARDMRRCTVHDSSVGAWGLNERSAVRMGLP